MKLLYLECKMGIAGDMMASALIDLFDDKEKLVEALNNIRIPKVKYSLESSNKCGILGSHLVVLVDGAMEESVDMKHSHQEADAGDNHHAHGEETHNSMYDIEEIIEGLNLSKEIKGDIREIYQLLAEAESRVHGCAISEVHFHEVGSLDAIADIAAVCYLMHELDPEKIIVSPINVGAGQVRCAHGILPVPAPATALLLKGIPSYSSDSIEGELCTPTGAALVKYFAFDYGPQPVMSVDEIGYGMGKKDFEQANCVRVMIGDISEDAEKIVELSCNIDDMTPEEIGYAKEMLFKDGALDVYTISADMKKERPGIVMFCMCREDRAEQLIKGIFKNTTTLGVRENVSNRYVLTRQIEKVDTPYGKVRVKRAFGYDVKRWKIEYDDLAGIAERTGKSIIELRKELESYISNE